MRLINTTYFICILENWTLACDHFKSSNLSANNFKKITRTQWVDTWARDTVMWYSSAETLFWQLSIDHNMDCHIDLQHQAAGSNRGSFFGWACATAEQAICIEARHRVCLHQNGASQSYRRDYFARWSCRMCLCFNKMCTLGSRGYFFLIDTDGSRRSRVNGTRSAEEKELLISTVSTFYFILGILRTILWSRVQNV